MKRIFRRATVVFTSCLFAIGTSAATAQAKTCTKGNSRGAACPLNGKRITTTATLLPHKTTHYYVFHASAGTSIHSKIIAVNENACRGISNCNYGTDATLEANLLGSRGRSLSSPTDFGPTFSQGDYGGENVFSTGAMYIYTTGTYYIKVSGVLPTILVVNSPQQVLGSSPLPLEYKLTLSSTKRLVWPYKRPKAPSNRR